MVIEWWRWSSMMINDEQQAGWSQDEDVPLHPDRRSASASVDNGGRNRRLCREAEDFQDWDDLEKRGSNYEK